MPDSFSVLGLDAHKAVGEKVVANTVAAVHIARRSCQWEVDVSQFLVGTQVGPGVRRAGVFPRSVLPRLNTKLAFLWE